MSTYYDKQGNKLRLGTKPLGGGGEAEVYNIVGIKTECAKIYKSPTKEQYQKLRAMIKNPPTDPMLSKGHRSIAWPLRLLFMDEKKRKFAGFVMPKLSRKSFNSLLQYSNPDNRNKKFHGKFTWYHLLNTARNLASAVAAIHDRGYVIGDIKEVNILVSSDTLTTIIDCDSFQVTDTSTGKVYRCPVGTPEFTPPQFFGKTFADTDKTIEYDSFGLAVLVFKLLMEDYHPFGGKWLLSTSTTINEKIKNGLFPYGRKLREIDVPPTAPPFEMLHPEIQKLFSRCFVDGHTDPSKRPTAHDWFNVLREVMKK